MHWADPAYAWLAVLLLPAWWLSHHAKSRKRRQWARLAGADFLPAPARSRAVAATQVLIYILVVAALCRPQWGNTEHRETRRSLDILVAVDVSRSMLADDAPPRRLALAKKAVSALPGFLGGDRVGLVAYAGSAFLVCPLTTDYDVFGQAVDALSPELLPVGGSSLAGAVREAARGFGARLEGDKILILVGDGEDHDGVEAAVRAARASGIRVFAFLTGTATGSLIPLPGGAFHRDRAGAIVSSKANPEAMRTLASATGGAAFDLTADPGALESLYRTRLAGIEGRSLTRVARQGAERFQVPLGVALALFMSAPFLAPWFRRSRP